MYQLVLLSEAVFGFSELFLKTPCVCPFPDGLFMNTPAHTMECAAVFDPHPLPSVFTDLVLSDFFCLIVCFPGGKNPQKETLCQCGSNENK